MESSYYSNEHDHTDHTSLQVIRHPSYHRFSLSWFDTRVFYVRISNFLVDDSTPKCLTLNHIRLSPDTILEVNNVRCSMDSDAMSCILRRDRVDKKSEEATFITTDSIRVTGSVKFEVFDREELLIFGVFEMSEANGFVGLSKNNASKKWAIKCESAISCGAGILKGKEITSAESASPTIDVYVAGCFSGTPIILTKTLVVCPNKKNRKGMLLHSIPEYDDIPEWQDDAAPGHDLQAAEYKNYRSDCEEECDSLRRRQAMPYIEEDGELSWFHAGVGVGVGIGLGVCLGIGIGVQFLVRTYHTTTRTFKRRLL